VRLRCVLGEMFTRKPILPGNSDLDQLDKIWRLCGTPNQHTWPDYDTLPGCDGVKRFSESYPRRVKHMYERYVLSVSTVVVISQLSVVWARRHATYSTSS
jgi:serine/threonine-protein kinase BUR1